MSDARWGPSGGKSQGKTPTPGFQNSGETATAPYELGVRCANPKNPAPRALSASRALHYKAPLGRTVKRLALRAHCFSLAGVALALPHEAHLGRAVKWLAIRTHRLAISGLRRSRSDREADYQCR